LFFRVDEEHIVEDEHGILWAIVDDPDWRKSNGQPERRRHIDAIRHGATAFVVTFTWDGKKITSFNDKTLLRLGEIVEEDGVTYARIVGEPAVDDIVGASDGQTTIAADVEAISRSRESETERLRLIDARLGQGRFRQDVLRHWDGNCAVSGVSVLAVIRASHIKPWAVASNSERLNPFNGLPLVGTLDALFDAGLITFEDAGKMLVSPRLSLADRHRLGLTKLRLRKRFPRESIEFIRYHRKHRFRS
jgi:putative restriction endonuclease